MKSILDPSFRYTPSFETDLRKSFARIRRKNRQDSAVVKVTGNVASIVRCRSPEPVGSRQIGAVPPSRIPRK